MITMTLKPMLASREYVALPCATALDSTTMPATDRRGIVARRSVWAGDVLAAAGKRVRTTGKHTGFVHRAGSRSWSPST